MSDRDPDRDPDRNHEPDRAMRLRVASRRERSTLARAGTRCEAVFACSDHRRLRRANAFPPGTTTLFLDLDKALRSGLAVSG